MEEPEPMNIDVSETMMPHDPCPPGPRIKKGDKVVKLDTLGNLCFGHILDSDTNEELSAVWEDGSKDNLNTLIHANPPKFAVYDRPYTMGTRVVYMGKEGHVCGTSPIVTGYLVGYESLFVLPSLRDHSLHPVLECTVGDTVICNGWVGVVVDGTVDITYKYSTGKQLKFLCVKESLTKAVERQYYPRMQIGKLPNDVLKKGSWSSGVTLFNYLSYRNKAPIIHRIQLSSLEVTWYDKIGSNKATEERTNKPPSLINGKEDIAKLFGLNEDTSVEEKFSHNSVWTVRYDENLAENYANWKESFVEEYILKGDTMEEAVPFFKRPKQNLNISSLTRVPVKVMFSQTEVEVLFDDGSILTTLSTKLMEPVSSKVQPCPYQDRRYLLGEVVKDRTDFFHPDKYGFIFSQNYTRRTVLVKWINVQRDGSVLVKEPQEMSQYDIVPFYRFYLLKNTPQIVIAKKKYEGMVKSICLVAGKVKVQCAEGPVKSFWAHELEFCTKKAFYSPHSGWETREIPLPLDVQPMMLYCAKNANSAKLNRSTDASTSSVLRKFLNTGIPEDNSWSKVISNPPEEDIMELEPGRLPDLSHDLDTCLTLGPTIYIEKFNLRKDIFTIVYVPTNADSVYQDIPFFLDFKITRKYPSSHALPRVIVRLPRVEDPSWIHPSIASDGQISFPEELRNSDNDSSSPALGPVATVLKFIIDYIFGNMEPFLGLRCSLVKDGIGIENISKNTNRNNNNFDEGEVSSENLKSCRDYNEACVTVLTEYIHGLLCNPPATWKAWIENHFKENLFRMCWRYIRFMEPIEDYEDESLITLNRKKNMSYLLYPVSHSFTLALKSRVDNLSTFIEPSLPNLSSAPP